MIKVDLHLHTCHSRDCNTPLKLVATACERAGVDCIAVTDHNTIAGALELQAAGRVRVIVGEEIGTASGELLGLFLREPVPAGLSPLETIRRVKEQGGLVCIPHPFSRWPFPSRQPMGAGNGDGFLPSEALRKRNALLTREVLTQVDMVEVMNARTPFADNWVACQLLASMCGLIPTAGSDAHTAREIGRATIEMPDFSDAESFLAAMRHAQLSGVRSSMFVHFASMYAKLRRKSC